MSPHYQLIKDLLDLDDAIKSRIVQFLLDDQTTQSEKHLKICQSLRSLGHNCTNTNLTGTYIYFHIFYSWQEEDTQQLAQDYAEKYSKFFKDIQ